MKKAKICLKFEADDKKITSTIFKSLSPDNVNIPKELSFNFKLSNNCVNLQVVTENDLETLISTVREVLDNMGLCVQTIMVNNNGKN